MTQSPRRTSVGGVHWPELDGLRALAILLVVARHSLRPFISEDTYAPVAAWGGVDLTPFLMNGWVGVDLFFVLSGFLIGRQAFRRDGWGRFWFKRVTRIVPAYWACLALVAVGLTASGSWAESGRDFAAHLVMLQDYTGSVFVPAFWSLGAEEKFYLLAPLLAVGLARLRSPVLQGAALAGLWLAPVVFRILATRSVVPPVPYETYFPSFRSPFHLTCETLVLGFVIAWATLHLRPEVLGPRAREAVFWSGAAGLLVALVPSALLGHIDRVTIMAMPAAIGLGFGAMVLACVSGPGSYSRCLSWRGWRPLALTSFSLYLTHMMVIPSAV
ncbi:MAG TPA: acyltransferase, partial [Thermoanaerobaculia bacterium]|nr:acyltransferase [Thermoanaerobaculia bacterium]